MNVRERTDKEPERSLGWPGRVVLGILFLAGLWLVRVDPFTVLFFVSYASVGTWLAVRRPRNFLGWLMVVIAFGFSSTTTTSDIDLAALTMGAAPLAERLDVWIGAWSGYAVLTGFIALTVLFPSGRLPERPWRTPGMLLLIGGLTVDPPGGHSSRHSRRAGRRSHDRDHPESVGSAA